MEEEQEEEEEEEGGGGWDLHVSTATICVS